MNANLLIKLTSFCFATAVLLVTPGSVYASVPSMDVTVIDAAGRVVFKDSLNANATFATRTLAHGKYVVQFNSKSSALRNNQYLAVVSAGKKKVIAAAVPGEKFTDGGAAIKIDVEAGLQITGQVAREQTITHGDRPMTRTIDGKRYLWVSAQTGSNLAGQWVEESVGPVRNITVWTADELRKRMDRGGEGSMLANHIPYDRQPTGY